MESIIRSLQDWWRGIKRDRSALIVLFSLSGLGAFGGGLILSVHLAKPREDKSLFRPQSIPAPLLSSNTQQSAPSDADASGGGYADSLGFIMGSSDSEIPAAQKIEAGLTGEGGQTSAEQESEAASDQTPPAGMDTQPASRYVPRANFKSIFGKASLDNLGQNFSSGFSGSFGFRGSKSQKGGSAKMVQGSFGSLNPGGAFSSRPGQGVSSRRLASGNAAQADSPSGGNRSNHFAVGELASGSQPGSRNSLNATQTAYGIAGANSVGSGQNSYSPAVNVNAESASTGGGSYGNTGGPAATQQWEGGLRICYLLVGGDKTRTLRVWDNCRVDDNPPNSTRGGDGVSFAAGRNMESVSPSGSIALSADLSAVDFMLSEIDKPAELYIRPPFSSQAGYDAYQRRTMGLDFTNNQSQTVYACSDIVDRFLDILQESGQPYTPAQSQPFLVSIVNSVEDCDRFLQCDAGNEPGRRGARIRLPPGPQLGADCEGDGQYQVEPVCTANDTSRCQAYAPNAQCNSPTVHGCLNCVDETFCKTGETAPNCTGTRHIHDPRSTQWSCNEGRCVCCGSLYPGGGATGGGPIPTLPPASGNTGGTAMCGNDADCLNRCLSPKESSCTIFGCSMCLCPNGPSCGADEYGVEDPSKNTNSECGWACKACTDHGCRQGQSCRPWPGGWMCY